MRQGPGRPPGGASDGRADPAALMRDWITIWQSEMSAAATDPDLVHAWTRLLEIWAATARGATLLIPPMPPAGAAARDTAPGGARPAPPAGSAAADAAPDARDAALERLARRVEELERRLAGLDPPASG
jgi:hypothetical protein